MCLIFISLNDHPDYKLIVAGNRDEFYNRKTSPAHFWETHPDVLAGKDLEAGGTWMGVTKKGKVSMVTNYRDLSNIDPQAPSRGHLVSDYLIEDQRPLPYLENISKNGKKYNGFNLIAGNANELYYYSNYKNSIDPIQPGIHGLSNHLLDTPWPKVEKGLKKMKEIMQSPRVDAEAILDALYNDVVAPDDKLPNTGVGLERERMLSPMFIKSQGYGSRSSTVLMIDRKNHVTFIERTYDTASYQYQAQEFSFSF